jgi:hypothetical protein
LLGGPRLPLEHEGLEAIPALGVAQLGQRPGFELTDPLARQTELATDLLQRVLPLALQTEPPAQDVALALAELCDGIIRGALEARMVEPAQMSIVSAISRVVGSRPSFFSRAL